jgi:hypothetical protein
MVHRVAMLVHREEAHGHAEWLLASVMSRCSVAMKI